MHILKLSSDIDTPVSIFLKVAESEDYSFLLESAEHEASFGRYSFLGIGKKDEIILSNEGKLSINSQEIKFKDSPLYEIEKLLKQRKVNLNEKELPPFFGGAVGYVSYDYIKYIENIDVKSSPFPIFHFIIPEHIIIFDHVKNHILIISDTPEDIVNKIKSEKIPTKTKEILTTEPIPNFSTEAFHKAVEKVKNYIIEGDIFQAVLSQRFNFKTNLNPFFIYRALRMTNPSPYMFYLKFKEKKLLGSSPEMMTKLTDDKAILKPIAGTRRRGHTVDEDLALEKELLSDEKEKAEHTMLIDLGRNDLGRVCEKGSVKLDENMIVERFSYVMHLVSQVSGKIEKGKTPTDLFESTFPAGTVTGAPKIRAMEIINELEPDGRGPYAGAVVYFSYPNENGKINMDSGIMIRSFFFNNEEAFLQAGAGIVYDSKPELEYKETINKLTALFQSLEIAKKIAGGIL